MQNCEDLEKVTSGFRQQVKERMSSNTAALERVKKQLRLAPSHHLVTCLLIA